MSRRLGTTGHHPVELFRSVKKIAMRSATSDVTSTTWRDSPVATTPQPVRHTNAWCTRWKLDPGRSGCSGGTDGTAFGAIPWLQTKRRAKRNVQLSQQLPDALDLISRSLQAGHGIADAMRLVAEEMPMPVAREFGRVYEENNLGRDFRDCMTEMASRNPHNFDLRIIVSATLLQRETGGNLIEILHNIAKTNGDDLSSRERSEPKRPK